jgi:hypothetical protein
MKKYVLVLLALGIASIAFGMAAKGIIPYAPTIGWLLGFCFFTSSTVIAFVARRREQEHVGKKR